MEYRKFGKAELNMSVLGFACGSVGRLMVCRKYKGMLKTTVECALEAGINQVSSDNVKNQTKLFFLTGTTGIFSESQSVT